MIRLRLLMLAGVLVRRWPAAGYALAHLAGLVAWALRPRTRRDVIRNLLPLCDGDRRAAGRYSRRVLGNVARYYVDLLTLPGRDMATFESRHLRIVGAERLAVLSAPGPVIALSAHAGNPELAVQALTYRGRPFVALVEALRPRPLAAHVLRLRSSAGGTFHESTFAGIRACLETLERGGLVGMLGDRDLTHSGVCVMLAGRRVRLPRGPWEFARRTGATVLPVFCERRAAGAMTLYVEEPFGVEASGEADAAVAAAAQRFACLLEQHLRRDPGQWAVLEDYWKVHACGAG